MNPSYPKTRQAGALTWTQRYEVASYLVDSSKKLHLHGLLSLMQETAWAHSAARGFGYSDSEQRGAGWVIIRQRIEMDCWPDWESALTVRTWLRPPDPVVVVRDFEFLVGEQSMGRAAAHWITIDQGTRRPIPLVFPQRDDLFRPDGHLQIEPQRLPPLSEPLEELAEFVVMPSDLDMYGHANNTRFAQWVVDSLPWTLHQRLRLREYQVNFLAEARRGDRVTIRRTASHAQGQQLSLHGWRASDQRVLFTARLSAMPRTD
jgi:medium-chain acyl-[acyl-carrier-protein] hydrolase